MTLRQRSGPQLFDRRGGEICIQIDSHGGAVWVPAWPYLLRRYYFRVGGVPMPGDEFQATVMYATVG